MTEKSQKTYCLVWRMVGNPRRLDSTNCKFAEEADKIRLLEMANNMDNLLGNSNSVVDNLDREHSVA